MPRFEASDGVSLAFEDEGEGAPVVLIHGWMMSRRFFHKQVQGLRSQRRVVTWDLRGCGDSGSRAGTHTLARFSKDLHELLERLDVQDATLVGWSLGGGITTRYLQDFGAGRVAAVALVDFPPRLHEAPDVADKVCHHLVKRRDGFTIDFLRRMFLVEPSADEIAWMLSESKKCSAETACEIYRQLRETALPSATPPYDLDALRVFPEHGWYPRAVDDWKRLFARHRAPMYSKSRHCPFLEEGERFNEDVLALSAP